MNGNLSIVIDDAKKLANAVFSVYPDVLQSYSTLIGPVSTPEQQKILFDLCVACIGISNKESRVAAWKEEKKNGNGGNSHPSPPTPPQPPKPPLDKDPITLEEPVKERDERDRPTEQLIQELNIKSPRQAGFLRYQGEISYREWQRVRDILSAREIKNGLSGVPA